MNHEDVLERLGERLNKLFEEKTKPDGKPYTNDEVSKATGIASSYFSKLRRGQAGNPSYMIMLRLSWFFDVPITYFSDGKVDTINQINIDDRFTDAIAARANRLSPESRFIALEMLEHIYKLEKKQKDTEDS